MMANKKAGVAKKVPLSQRIAKELRHNWILYLMILPVLIYYIIFSYAPMYGIVIAFKDYKVKQGILGSAWVGLKHFKRFFGIYNFSNLLKNTLTLSIYSLLVGFPIPIIFALILNYSTRPILKKATQMISYAPHFISTMVVCGMIRIFLSPSGGLLNLILGTQTDFLTESAAFRTIYIASGIWQDAGWGCIIYLATLATVDMSLYEAAKVDGASVLQRIIHIDFPALIPMAILNLIMSAGSLMNVGFEKAWLLQTDLNMATSDIIAVYVYQQGIENAKYSYSTAVGLFNTAINLILLFIVNRIAKKYSSVEFL